MKNSLSKLLLAALLLGLFACGQTSETNKNEDANEVQETAEENAALQPDEKQVEKEEVLAAFKFEYIEETEENLNPSTIVTLVIGEQEFEIASLPGEAQIYKPEAYKDMEIPETAISACGGWWAGGGEYLYMQEQDNKIVIYKGWVDEMQEDKSYHWERFKEIEK